VIGRERHGAFGGAFGGLVTACCVLTARSAAPGKVPTSLDSRFLRALPAGEARLVPAVIHDGRTLTCVSVDVFDSAERRAARATVSLVAVGALDRRDHPGAAGRSAPPPALQSGKRLRQPPGGGAPIIDTLAPHLLGEDERGLATGLRVPWDEPGNAAEAACLAADICVGAPVAGAFAGEFTPAPNPDLSLRFIGDVVGAQVVGYGRLERMEGGIAAVRVEVWSAARLVAIGVCCSLLIPR